MSKTDVFKQNLHNLYFVNLILTEIMQICPKNPEKQVKMLKNHIFLSGQSPIQKRNF